MNTQFLITELFSSIILPDNFNETRKKQFLLSIQESILFLKELLIDNIVDGNYIDDVDTYTRFFNSKKNDEDEFVIKSHLDEENNNFILNYQDIYNPNELIISELYLEVKDDIYFILNCYIDFLQNIFLNQYTSQEDLTKYTKKIKNTNGKFDDLVFHINLVLIEYNLNEGIEYYTHLKELKEEKNESSKKFNYNTGFYLGNVIDYKIKFLQYKWKKRQKYNKIFLSKNSLNHRNQIFLFSDEIIDLNEKVFINSSEVKDNYYSTFKEWIDKIEYHYFENCSDELSSNKKNHSIKDNNFYNYYFKVKYFKDELKDLQKLKGLSERGDVLFNNEKYKANYLYFLNNKFSLMIDYYLKNKVGISKEHIEDEYSVLTNTHSKFSNSNFFIHYKYLLFKTHELKKDIKEISNYEANNFQLIENKMAECMRLCNLIDKNIQWTSSTFKTIFSLSKEENIIFINNQKVYFANSFFLPVSITEYKKKASDLEEELVSLKNDFTLEINRNSLKLLEDKLKLSEKKSIEVIAIFTAIISFILGTTGGFKFIDNIFNAIAFTIFFGISLIVFTLIILFYSNDKFRINYIVFIGSILILTIVGSFCLSVSNNNVLSKNDLKKELINLNIIKKESSQD